LPLEIKEHILRDLFAVQFIGLDDYSKDKHYLHLLIFKTDARWLYQRRSFIRLPTMFDDITEQGRTVKFFNDVLEFERVVCRCGVDDSSTENSKDTDTNDPIVRGSIVTTNDWRPIRTGRHLNFCNTSCLSLDLKEVDTICFSTIQSAFKCMRALTEFHIVCLDTDMSVASITASWMSVVPTLKVLRFRSVEVMVSNHDIVIDI
jgi:hypothetical protein